MSVRQLVAAASCLISVSAAAHTFDVNLSNDAAMLSYTSALGQQGFGHGQMGAELLFTDNSSFSGRVGFGVVGEAGSGSPGLMVGVGVNLYGVTTDDSDVAAVALNGNFEYAPPPLNRLRLGGELNLAPSIVTFMDGDNLFDGSLYAGYEIFQEAVAYIGYRQFKIKVQNGKNETVDSGGYIGIKFKF